MIGPGGTSHGPFGTKKNPTTDITRHRRDRHNDGMATHVALLRGINVGGRNKVPMAELREVVVSLGHTGVTTYIQSGNVLFTTSEDDPAKLAAALEAAIAEAFGVRSPVVVLSREDLARILDTNPHPEEPNPKLVHVVFLNAEPPPDVLDRINAAQSAAAAKGSADTVTAIGPALFLHTPAGFGTSDLAQVLLRIIGPPSRNGIAATARNWATSTKLLALCEEK
ncbi:MAG TPA: DUF1697 domain-containing protein [Streptosporangiaceae bacterium]|nr:DUF1697 domain-containing protein [Streptosporangiaceae bacterium]